MSFDSDTPNQKFMDTTLEISVSESSSDDEFDPLQLLMGKNNNIIVNKLEKKRSSLFEVDENGIKRLRPPPKPTIFPQWDNRRIHLLKESSELGRLHEEDQENALKKLYKLNESSTKIIAKLNPSVVKNNPDYVEYLTSNANDSTIYDFHFFQTPPHLQKYRSDQLPEVFALPFEIRGEIILNQSEIDIFSELDPNIVEQAINTNSDVETSVKYIDNFMHKIGVSHSKLHLKRITSQDLEIDPKESNPDINLILLKFKYLVSKLSKSSYDKPKFERIIKLIGLTILDKRVYSEGDTHLICFILKIILSWQFRYKQKIELDKITDIWYQLSDSFRITYRIIEVLQTCNIKILKQLKVLLALKIFIGPDIEIKPEIKSDEKFGFMVYSVIDSELRKWRQTVRKLADDSEQHDFTEIRLKFQSLLHCIDISSEDLRIQKILENLIYIKNQLPSSSSKYELSSLKTLLMLLVTSLSNSREDVVYGNS